MGQKKNSLVGGFAILSVAGIFSKLIGMFFQLKLTDLIGLGGQGLFQTVYPTYTLLLTISTAGIPVAISRMVSENITLHRFREIKALMRTALILLTGIGASLMLLLIALAYPLSLWVKDPASTLGYQAIAPSILIVSVMSVFRGYMQGRTRMAPTAVSQLIEQLAKVLISSPLAILGSRYGLAQAAGGALLGITISEGLAMLFMAAVYLFKRHDFAKEESEDLSETSSFRALAMQMLRIAVPITIGSMIVPLSLNIDTAMIKRLLMSVGFSLEDARVRFGALNGPTSSLINVPTVFATAVSIGLVPIIASARVENRKEDMHRTSLLGLRLASLISFPCAIGMSILATPILHLLYQSSLTPEELILTGDVLSLSALTIFFFTQVQATTGILQGAGLQKIPMYSLVLGVLLKIAFNYSLVSIPSINIFGAPIASMICYGTSMIINLIFIVRKTGLKIRWGDVLIRPGAATAGMAVVVLIMMQILDMNRRASTLLAIFAGILVYIALVFALGVLRRDDMGQVPGGRYLERLMRNLGVWRT